MAQVKIQLDEILGYFDALEDPRSDINRKYPLVSVVVIAMMAVLAGAGGPTAIARWANFPDRKKRLAEWLDLPEGNVPCKDVFRRVLCLVQPAAFQECFVQWLQLLRAQAAAATGVEQPVLAVDGKTLRRRHDRKKNLGTLHSVSVWASEFGLSLGQTVCAEKSNEITAIPELLRLVDIQGTIITIDAMGTQKAIAAQIVDGRADYLLAVKGNQETLYRAVREALASLAREGSHQARIEQSRGRTELREYHVMPAGDMVKQFPMWKGLSTLGVAIGYRRDSKGNESLEYRYYISSAALTEEQFAKGVRGHWGIENQLHWVLDVTMKEDACPIYRGDAAQILATVRHMALNMLRAEKGKTASIRRKQKIAAMNSDYLEQVILAGITAANKN